MGQGLYYSNLSETHQQFLLWQLERGDSPTKIFNQIPYQDLSIGVLRGRDCRKQVYSRGALFLTPKTNLQWLAAEAIKIDDRLHSAHDVTIGIGGTWRQFLDGTVVDRFSLKPFTEKDLTEIQGLLLESLLRKELYAVR